MSEGSRWDCSPSSRQEGGDTQRKITEASWLVSLLRVLHCKTALVKIIAVFRVLFFLLGSEEGKGRIIVFVVILLGRVLYVKRIMVKVQKEEMEVRAQKRSLFIGSKNHMLSSLSPV